MKPRVSLLILVIAVCSLFFLARLSSACIVGSLEDPPGITITDAPPDCCYGSWAGSVSGVANNLDTDSVAVVLYAQTNVYWVQPYDFDPWTDINCDGTFINSTHGGHHYCAILAKRTWDAPATMGYLPPVGGAVLAIACAPDGPRTVEFGGYTWQIKQAGDIKIDPGPNYFRDAYDNVWVDESDRLHLKITHEDDKWYCAEVFTDAYLGYGLYEFEVEGPIDEIDPYVVFAGFTYSDQGDEIDIEFSRWGDPGADNAQFCMQPWDTPGNRHRFPMAMTGTKTCHYFEWTEDQVEFASCQHGLDESGDLIEAWVYDGADNPDPDIERMRFNLWLHSGHAPLDQEEVEVIITDFRFIPADSPTVPARWGDIKALFR